MISLLSVDTIFQSSSHHFLTLELIWYSRAEDLVFPIMISLLSVDTIFQNLCFLSWFPYSQLIRYSRACVSYHHFLTHSWYDIPELVFPIMISLLSVDTIFQSLCFLSSFPYSQLIWYSRVCVSNHNFLTLSWYHIPEFVFPIIISLLSVDTIFQSLCFLSSFPYSQLIWYSRVCVSNHNFLTLSWYHIPEFVVPIMISLLSVDMIFQSLCFLSWFPYSQLIWYSRAL